MQTQDRTAELVKGALGNITEAFIDGAAKEYVDLGRVIARFGQCLDDLRAHFRTRGFLQPFPVQIQKDIGFGDYAFAACGGQKAAIITPRQIFIGLAQVDHTAVAYPVIKRKIFAHPHDAGTGYLKRQIFQPVDKDQRCTGCDRGGSFGRNIIQIMLQANAIGTVFVIAGQVGNLLIAVAVIKIAGIAVFNADFKADTDTSGIHRKVFKTGQKLRAQTLAAPVIGNRQRINACGCRIGAQQKQAVADNVGFAAFAGIGDQKTGGCLTQEARKAGPRNRVACKAAAFKGAKTIQIRTGGVADDDG